MTSLPPLPPYLSPSTLKHPHNNVNLQIPTWPRCFECLCPSAVSGCSVRSRSEPAVDNTHKKNLLYHQWFTKVITLLFQILIRWSDFFFFSMYKTTQPWSFNVQLQSSLWHHSYHSIRVIVFSSASLLRRLHLETEEIWLQFPGFSHLCNSKRACIAQPRGQSEVLLSLSLRTSNKFLYCCNGVIQLLTSPRFLCSSVSSSWCLILIWAISCCRTSLRHESVPELKQETWQVSTWRGI